MTQPFRIQPLGHPADYKTYSLLAPLETHWRAARCAEVDCAVSASGWFTAVDEATGLGHRQAGYIRTQAGRHITENAQAELTVFTFPAGEECFTAHRIKADREPFYLVRRGDFRGFDDKRQHDRAKNWVEDFALHQDKIDHQLNG